MKQPDKIIGKSRLTANGALKEADLGYLRNKLLDDGLVLLPSDTCYSLGALAMDTEMPARLNAVLSRGDEPFSLAGGSYRDISEWIVKNGQIDAIFERFTPGPLTVVCKASDKVRQEFTSEAIASGDRTIGFRIPDSAIERELARSTNFFLATPAVRDPKTGRAIRDFEQAVEFVGKGIARVGDISWDAVEGKDFFPKSSTVIRMTPDSAKAELLREGPISLDEIEQVLEYLPQSARGNWN